MKGPNGGGETAAFCGTVLLPEAGSGGYLDIAPLPGRRLRGHSRGPFPWPEGLFPGSGPVLPRFGTSTRVSEAVLRACQGLQQGPELFLNALDPPC